MECGRWWRSVAVGLLMSVACGVASAAPEVGWYWNPNESGRGFFIESQNGIIYLGGYFYESDGRATWLVAGGPNADPYSYQGRLSRYAGGQTLFGAYRVPAAPTDAGPVSVQFSDDRHATLTWPGGTIALEREVFGTGAAAFQPQSGWWWDPDESGRGYSIEVQGDSLFLVGFMYDDAGNPVWYFSAGPLSTPTHFEGQVLQFANGQTEGGAYQPPTAPTPIGHLTLDFTGASAATVTFTDAVAAMASKSGRTVTRQLVREFKQPEVNQPQLYLQPPKYKGTFSLIERVRDQSDGEEDTDFYVNGDLTFIAPAYDGNPKSVLVYRTQQNPLATPLHVHIDLTTRDDLQSCKGNVDMDYPLPAGETSSLVVADNGEVEGDIQIPVIVIPLLATCTTTDGDVRQTPFLKTVGVRIHFTGSVDGDRIKGGYSFTIPIGETSGGIVDYSFAAVR